MCICLIRIKKSQLKIVNVHLSDMNFLKISVLTRDNSQPSSKTSNYLNCRRLEEKEEDAKAENKMKPPRKTLVEANLYHP